MLKYAPKQKETHLYNGIEYIHREIEGLAQPMQFPKEQIVPVRQEEVTPQEINLMALSQQDMVKPEEPSKDTFVTNN